MVRLLGICLLCVSAGGAVGAEPKEPQEPVHDGKPVSQWLADLSAKDRATRDKAAEAVTTIVKTDVPRVSYGKFVTRRAPEPVSDSLLLAQPDLLKEHAGVLTPLLVKMLKDEDATARVSAVRVLVLIGAKADGVTPALQAALEDASWDVRRHAAVALAKADPKQVEAMVAFLLKAPAGEIHYRRIATCWENETPLPALGAAAIPYLVPNLAHEDAAVRDRAAQSLCLMGEPAVLSTIKALSAEKPALRAAAARCLGRMANKTPGWQSSLRAALGDKEREVRLTAAQSLGLAEIDATIPVFLDALIEGATDERGRAAVAILSLGDVARASAKTAAPVLEKKLLTADGSLDLDVADVLVFLDPSRAKNVAALLDRSTVTVRDEVQILVRIGRIAPATVPQVVPALTGILKNSRKGVGQQCEAVRALGEFGKAAKSAVPALVEAAKGQNEILKKIASRTLPLIDPDELDYPRDLQTAPYNPNEAIRATFSLTKATEYVDVAAQDWMRTKSCGGCHANVSYMMVRPLLKSETSLLADSRKFIETRLDQTAKSRFAAEVVSNAAALAFDDARTGQLRPSTRKALDRMWSVLPVSSCNSDTLVVELSPEFERCPGHRRRQRRSGEVCSDRGSETWTDRDPRLSPQGPEERQPRVPAQPGPPALGRCPRPRPAHPGGT